MKYRVTHSSCNYIFDDFQLALDKSAEMGHDTGESGIVTRTSDSRVWSWLYQEWLSAENEFDRNFPPVVQGDGSAQFNGRRPH